MTFQEFCDRYANPELIEITCTDEVPREFVEPINTLVNLIRLKVQRADTIKISFIQNKFDDMNEVRRIMNDVYHGEVNESISQALSKNLYGLEFGLLTSSEMAIIKVLTIYLMIQNATNEY